VPPTSDIQMCFPDRSGDTAPLKTWLSHSSGIVGPPTWFAPVSCGEFVPALFSLQVPNAKSPLCWADKAPPPVHGKTRRCAPVSDKCVPPRTMCPDNGKIWTLPFQSCPQAGVFSLMFLSRTRSRGLSQVRVFAYCQISSMQEQFTCHGLVNVPWTHWTGMSQCFSLEKA